MMIIVNRCHLLKVTLFSVVACGDVGMMLMELLPQKCNESLHLILKPFRHMCGMTKTKDKIQLLK